MNSTPTKIGVGDDRVALFQQLVRDLDHNIIRRIIYNAPEEHLVDYLVMAFHTRDVRGGKGQRYLLDDMLEVLFVRRPTWIVPAIELVPIYGYWKDLWRMYDSVWIEDDVNGRAVRLAINALVKRQFEADMVAERPSLLAKWMPREKSAHKKLAHHFAGILFGHMEGAADRDKLAAYRKAVAGLNRKLATAEINMCGGSWAEIKPDTVPGRCLMKNRNAFFLTHKHAKLTQHQDRIKCRDNFVAHVDKEKAIKEATAVYPHEIVMRLHRGCSDKGATLLEAQWASIREKASKAGGLRKIVPMCDFHRSMDGIPLYVSIALGILVSEVAIPAFKDYIMSFDYAPKWISFRGCATLREKISTATAYSSGCYTNFEAAYDLLLKRLIECAVPADEAPEDLLVFTNMGYNRACDAVSRPLFMTNSHGHIVKSSSLKGHCEKIMASFTAAGYKVPRIIIWNLGGACVHEEEGVLQLSGWSPVLLNIIQNERISAEAPYQAVRAVLDDERYNAVREAVASAAGGAGSK